MWIYTNVGRGRHVLHLENGVKISLREAATSPVFYITTYYSDKYFVDLAGPFEISVAQSCLDLIAARLQAMDTAQRGLPQLGVNVPGGEQAVDALQGPPPAEG
ncbi:MAG TPA: hypothetical protein VFA07_05920 [Chthonomonadaceae bacterium]|nr:hypothetical protein [Chthonomonadaceae bacterium]